MSRPPKYGRLCGEHHYLNGDALVVLVHGLRHVDFEWSVGLTFRASAGFHFLVLILEKWSQNEAAFGTIVFDHGELRHNSGCASDDSGSTDQLVQMQLTKRTDVCEGGGGEDKIS